MLWGELGLVLHSVTLSSMYGLALVPGSWICLSFGLGVLLHNVSNVVLGFVFSLSLCLGSC